MSNNYFNYQRISTKEERGLQKYNSYNGKQVRALVEERHRDGSYTARMANNFVVKFTDDSECLDKFVTLEITGKKGTSLTAKLLNK